MSEGIEFFSRVRSAGGSSYILTIPKEIVEIYGLKEKDYVRVILEKVKPKKTE